MNELTVDELRTTLQSCQKICVSLFMPTHRQGQVVQEDRIRYKNLLHRALENLTESGMRRPEAAKLLEPAVRLIDEGIFWEHRGDGLAVFIAPGYFRHYSLPASLEELVVVSSRFHVKPILPAVSGNGQFYVLALSQKMASLSRQTRHSVEQIDLGGVAHGLADLFRDEFLERQIQFRGGGGGGGGGGNRLFHPHGGKTDDPKDLVIEYFNRVDASLAKIIGGDHIPLVLAGVEFLFPLYREANTYPHLLEEGIGGNPEEMSADELRERAWAVVEPHFQATKDLAAAKYEQLAGTGHAENELEPVVRAAVSGQVDVLFVALGVQRWGTFNEVTGEPSLHEDRQVGDADLLDLAAGETMLHGGRVYAEEADRIPGGGSLAAIYRYPSAPEELAEGR